MCPQLEVREEVFSALQERAEPFVDAPDSVLRWLLSRGEIRWRNRVQFVRLKLIKSRELVEGSPGDLGNH